MAVAFDNATSTQTTAGTDPITFAHTCTGTNLLLIVVTMAVDFPPSESVIGVTYNSVAMTEIPNFGGLYNDASLDVRLQGWYLVAPATGSNTVSVDWSAGAGERACIAASFTGVDQSTPVENGTNSTGTSTSPSINVSSAVNNMVLAGFGVGQPTQTPDGGQDLRDEEENINFASSLGVSTEAGAGTVTLAYTFGAGGNGDKWSFGGVSIKAVSTGPRFILGTH